MSCYTYNIILKLFIFGYNTMALLLCERQQLGGHRGLQDYMHICYYFYVFYVYTFFQNPKSRDFLRFLPCFVRFLELCSQPNSSVYSAHKRLPVVAF